LAWTNGALLFWNGCAGHFQTQYRIVTFAVALLFVVIGGILLGVERSLLRIRQYCVEISRVLPRSESAGAWRLLYVCLIAGLLFISVVMGSSLVAITGRLHQGFNVFG
jgi:hypothetical protein